MRKMKLVPVLVLFVVIAGAFSMMPYTMAADAKFSSVPQTPCAPGSTVTLSSDSNFDLGIVTAKITQNGVEHVSSFNMNTAHQADSMASGSKSGGMTIQWAGYRDSDEIAELYMTVLYDNSVASREHKNGLRLKFLVTELSGNNVPVVLTGKKDGADQTLSATVPTVAINSSLVTATGKFMQRNTRESYFQGEPVHIYALGYNSSAEVVIKDLSGNTVTTLTAPCAGKLAYFAWNIPKDQTEGNYTIGIKPSGGQTDAFGQSGAYTMSVGVVKSAPLKEPPSGTLAPLALPGWAPLAMVAAVLIVGVPIGVLLIRKKKD